MATTYKACLVGCGRMGGTIDDEMQDKLYFHHVLPHTHAGACKAVDRIDLTGASDVVEEKVNTLCERYDVPNGYLDYEEMIQKEKPQILCVATRPDNHRDIIVFAAEHGVRAIYCDKPLCCSMAEADAILDACTRHGVKFNYGVNRRYMPIYRKMRELVEQEAIGQLQSVTLLAKGMAQWSLTHASDMLMQMAGEPEVEFVQGHCACKDEDFDGNRVQDPGIHMGYVRFVTGVTGHILPGTGWEFEACGTGGRLRTYNDMGELVYRKATEDGMLCEMPQPPFNRESGTVAAMQDLVHALDTDGETMGPLHLACRSQEIIIGMVESHRLGGIRVPLPLENRQLYVGTK
ncbi:MAG: Gfo/Idh/MocA family oxidoreductase [Planctomycetes bacterium]|nr:Gfo/Idh/MocA family oxidoreductase [Planctomycetota bacterium]